MYMYIYILLPPTPEETKYLCRTNADTPCKPDLDSEPLLASTCCTVWIACHTLQWLCHVAGRLQGPPWLTHTWVGGLPAGRKDGRFGTGLRHYLPVGAV